MRPRYSEALAAEEAKLEAVRRRTREAQGMSPSSVPASSPRTQRSNSHESDANARAQAQAIAAEHARTAAAAQAAQADEASRRERRERKARKETAHAADYLADRLGRPTDIPAAGSAPRSRKFSMSPRRPRGPSSVSKDDFVGGGPLPYAAVKPTVISGSVPTSSPSYGSPPHVGGPGYPLHHHIRRRHSVSSPSLEKQSARQNRSSQPAHPPPPAPPTQPAAAVPQDSGYSSPSSPKKSPPMTFEKKHVSANNHANPAG